MPEVIKHKSAPTAKVEDTPNLAEVQDSAGKVLDKAFSMTEGTEEVSVEKLKKMTLTDMMKALGIPNTYEDRYDLIHELYDNGIILFDGSLNPYTEGEEPSKYEYIGNYAQNKKFKYQIIKNRHLFKNGKLTNPKKWEM